MRHRRLAAILVTLVLALNLAILAHAIRALPLPDDGQRPLATVTPVPGGESEYALPASPLPQLAAASSGISWRQVGLPLLDRKSVV